METAADYARGVRVEPIPLSATGPRRRLVLALARPELRHLFRHPTFLAPMALFVPLAVQAAFRDGGLIGTSVYLLAGLLVGTFLSANVAAFRARRDAAEELFGSLPSPAVARTAAQLSSIVLGPAAIAFLVPVAVYAARPFATIRSRDELTASLLAYFLGFFPLIVVVMGSMGVALGRWIPSPIAAPVVLVAHATTPLLILMVPWIFSELDAGISARTVGWNLAYLFGLTVLWTSLAFWRDRRGPGPVVLAGAGLGLAVAGAILQTPPGGYG